MPSQITSIQRSNLIEDTFLIDNANLLQTNYKKRQLYRTETEMRISVLDDISFPTKASKYWQCIREQSGMIDSLLQSSFEYRKKHIQLKEKQSIIAPTELEKIEIEEIEFGLINLRLDGDDRIREIKLWQSIMEELDDGSFNIEDVNVHQLESYNMMFRKQAEVLGENGSPSENANLAGQLRTSQRFLELGLDSCYQLNSTIQDKKVLE